MRADPAYGTMISSEESFDNYDASHPLPHSSGKLREMWKELCSAYIGALSRFTRSGTHDSDFLNFCGNRCDVFYLRCWLNMKPNLLNVVSGKLPPQARLSTNSDGRPDTESDAGLTVSEGSAENTPTKKRKAPEMERLLLAVESVAQAGKPNLEDERRALMLSIEQGYKTLNVVRSADPGSEMEAIILAEIARCSKRLKESPSDADT